MHRNPRPTRRRSGGNQTSLLLTLGLVALPGPAVAQSLDLGASVQYSRGEYIFTEPTETVSFYGSLGFRHSRLRVTLGLPVVTQDTHAITVVGGHSLPTGGPDHGAVAGRGGDGRVPMGGQGRGTGGPSPGAWDLPSNDLAGQTMPTPDTVEGPGARETHVGDPLLTAALEVWTGTGAVRAIEVTGSVKPPLADLDSGIGTGQWDAGLGASMAFGLGRTLVFTDLAWWSYGDLPDLELQDGLSWSAAVGRPLGERTTGMIGVWGGNRIIATADPPLTLSALLSRRLGDHSSVGLSIGSGLTESAQDLSLALSFRTSRGP